MDVSRVLSGNRCGGLHSLSQSGYFFTKPFYRLCPYQRPSPQVALHLEAERLISCITANPNSCIKAAHDGLTIINSDLKAVVESISCSSAGPFLTRLTLQWCPYCSKDPAAPQPIPTPRGSTTYCQSNTSSMPVQFQAPGTPVQITMQRSCSTTAVPTHTQKHSEPKSQPKHQNHRTTKPTDIISKWPTSWGKPS